MLILVSWTFEPKDREKVYDRFREVRNKSYPGVEALGRWHVLGRNAGVAVVEAENQEALGALITDWNDVCQMNCDPVVVDDEYASAIGA